MLKIVIKTDHIELNIGEASVETYIRSFFFFCSSLQDLNYNGTHSYTFYAGVGLNDEPFAAFFVIILHI